jgi:signal transduction histidine kinase
MVTRKSGRRPLSRERKKTDRSLKSERSATDRSMTRQAEAGQRRTDAARRKIRHEAERGLSSQRKEADAERDRRSEKTSSRELERERHSAAASLVRERRRADQVYARERRRFESVLTEEGSRRRANEAILFDRERRRTDRDLAGERGRTDTAFLAGERRLEHARTAREKAAAAVLLRDEFMAIVSHDLRTPLNVIAINAARLEQVVPGGEGDEKIRKMCLQIGDAVGRIGRMVDDLLETERLALAKLRLPTLPGDLRDLAREAIDLVAPVASAREISLRSALPETPVVTLFDRDRMLQVFSNLLGNAIKFAPKGSLVQLVVEPGDGLVRVSVSDAGPGISPEHHARIFRRFTQVAGGREGVGLGLYIARRIVEAHGGKIGLMSRPGEGSTFFFTLPRTPKHKRTGKGGNQ